MKPQSARILVIDDDPQLVEVLTISLGEEGYQVQGACAGAEGLRLFISSQPDLVLLDIGLPGGIDGIELLRRIRSIVPTSRVIMVTGNTTPERARESLELGASAYIDKPFDFAYLKRVVAMALQSEAG